MSLYAILAIIVCSFACFFALMSLIGDKDNPSHIESWRKNRHAQRQAKLEKNYQLRKLRLEFEAELKRLEVEKIRAENRIDIDKMDVDYTKP